MDFSDDVFKDIFAGLYEPFAGLEEMDFELHGIYMDHEAQNEFLSPLNKCNDSFLNVLLSDDNLRNSSIADEVTTQVYHAADWRCDEEVVQEIQKKKYRIHDPNTRWDLMEPKLGDMFESIAQLKFCVQNYAVANGLGLYYEKCDTTRLVVRCGKRSQVNECPYRLYAGWMYNEKTLQVKSLEAQHVCSRKFKIGAMVTPEWIGRHYITEIANKPKLKLRDMIVDMKQKYKCVVSIGQVRRARAWAKELIEGKLTEHYARIWDYGNELKRSNPGSSCFVGVKGNPDGNNYFQRFYIGFKALTEGWKRGCRKVIGLDGCFLKGHIKGELLTAIGRDANNQVYPIAWAVVDVESKDNWTWFIELLRDDLDIGRGNGLVIISDQHKGLVEAVRDVVPNVEHRQCARHIYANFGKAFTGLEFKKLFWGASMSCVEADFLKYMESIKRLSPHAYEYLMSKQPKSWSRAYFGTGYACEAVENGLSECFNSIIVDARKKPLITMLEEIRIYVMDKFAYMNEESARWTSPICPAVIRKMKLFGKNMRKKMCIKRGGRSDKRRRDKGRSEEGNVGVVEVIEEGGNGGGNGEGVTVIEEGGNGEGVTVPNAGTQLHDILDEVEKGINAILGDDEADVEESNVEGSNVVFNEGNDDDDAVTEKVYLDAVMIATYLEAGYTMEELRSIPELELEEDFTPPVELARNKVADHPYEQYLAENKDGVDDQVQAAPLTKKRRPSERQIKLKLKKAVYDKDGGGSSATNPVGLE